MSQPETAYCGHCRKDVPYHYDPVNHGKHLLMTIFSMGLWLPIWICVVFGPSKMCDECNNPMWSDPPSQTAAEGRKAS